MGQPLAQGMNQEPCGTGLKEAKERSSAPRRQGSPFQEEEEGQADEIRKIRRSPAHVTEQPLLETPGPMAVLLSSPWLTLRGHEIVKHQQ